MTIPVGGLYQLEVDGVPNGATVTFTCKGCKGGDIPAVDTSGTTISFTAIGRKLVTVNAYEKISGTITGAGASTNLSAILYRVPYSA